MPRPKTIVLIIVLECGAATSSRRAAAAPPELDAWLLNASGLTGYGGLPANVQRIHYSSGSAYVNSSDVPSYSIGPWPGNLDGCLGHPAPGGVYHHHQNPRCLYAADSTRHSPLLGYAFDGFPIYGAYGNKNADGSGGLTRIKTSYRVRSITVRTTLPDGTVLAPAQYGPPVSATYPLGYYIEDFEYVVALGDLDEHNGRLSVTPEYPSGIYAYYATIDASEASAYPYAIGPTYYGVVAADDISSHGHVTISEPVADWTPTWLDVPGGPVASRLSLAQSAPNPSRGGAIIEFTLPAPAWTTIRLYDLAGRHVATVFDAMQGVGTHTVPLDASGIAPGMYLYRLVVGGETRQRRMTIVR